MPTRQTRVENIKRLAAHRQELAQDAKRRGNWSRAFEHQAAAEAYSEHARKLAAMPERSWS